MAKARKHKRAGMTIPLAVVAGFAPLAMGELGAVKRALSGDTACAAQQAVIYATGYNTDTKAFHWPTFVGSYGPILAGMVVHKLAGRLGVNRAIAKAGVPFIRI
jgi:hypothetical protein